MRILNYLFILLFPFVGIGQISFFRTYSNEGFDRGEGICQLKDSSYLITGSSSSFSSNSKQAFIMHVDSLGNFLWSKDYGGSESDKGRRIFNVENDGIYVIGQSNSIGSSFYDAYFFKTDNSGNLLFEKRFGGDSYEDVFDAVMLKDTSFIVVGETSSTPNEVENVYIFRVNKFGDRLWTKSLGSNFPDRAKSVKILNDTIVYIAGEMYDENLMKQRGMLMKMHIDGTVEWTNLYGSETKHGFNDLNIFNDTIRVVGYTQRDLSTAKNDYFRFILDLAGVNWDEQFTNFIGSRGINGIEIFNNSEVVISVTLKDEPLIPTYEFGVDNIVYKYDKPIITHNAAINISKQYDDIQNQMLKTNDRGIVCVGYNSDGNFERVTLLKIDGRSSFTYEELVMDASNLVKIEEKGKLKAVVYPNPTDELLKIKTELKPRRIELYSAIGDLVLSTDQLEINVSNLPEGLYFLSIYQENGQFIQTKISIVR